VLRKDARRRMLAEALDEAAVRAHHLQFDRAGFLRLAEERYDALEGRRVHAAGGRRP
jgi:hypothetical protein